MWGVTLRRGSQRIDDDRSFLPLEFVHRPNTRAGKSLLQFKDLRVVWSYNEYVIERERLGVAVHIDPLGLAPEEVLNQCLNLVRLLRGGALVAAVGNRKEAQAAILYEASRYDPLIFQSWP